MLLAVFNVVAGFLRRTWLVALFAIVVCAALAARAVAALSDAALTSSTSRAPGAPGAGGGPGAPPASASSAGPASARRRAPTAEEADAFVVRNIFCSSCAPPPVGHGLSSEYRGEPAVLIATSIGAAPRATVRVVATEVQGSWGLSEIIPGVGRLDQIYPTAIDVVDPAGHGKRISLLDAPAAGSSGPGAATPEARPAAAGEPDPFRDSVTKIDDTTYAIDRSLVRELVMGTTKPGGVRVFPVMDAKGDVKGVRLVGVRKPSVADALSLHSGDLISTIDGEPLKNAQQLLDLFAKLDQINAVELGGTRTGNKPLHLTLRLR
ncbi:MAG TPA: hypothetical protein VN253_11865 [Kofleriaceae bacterium]|nr:hypothetical protein [Kofleriaceae bacterium]